MFGGLALRRPVAAVIKDKNLVAEGRQPVRKAEVRADILRIAVEMNDRALDGRFGTVKEYSDELGLVGRLEPDRFILDAELIRQAVELSVGIEKEFGAAANHNGRKQQQNPIDQK